MNKSDTRAFINQLLVYTLVMICFSGSVGLGAVWMRHQISVTAKEASRLNTQIAETERRIADTTIKVTAEQSPEALDRRNREWRLGLVSPVEPQVTRLAGSPEERLKLRRNRELFGRESVSLDAVAPDRGGQGER